MGKRKHLSYLLCPGERELFLPLLPRQIPRRCSRGDAQPGVGATAGQRASRSGAGREPERAPARDVVRALD